ncbi:FKBP-type peptidyl-prolyl cis-trans isomerase [Methanoplanus endosymbiosus]|uniref:Peptidyl-prolyl cis-trans isomerase n=1 Tax=Methanoplanus endosymbiosus TaxID=33865 RepID=A0A9E7PKZ8_9EURY|nr:peptidylprolyl isomerase [Methanoplanus endosymbiosus]UUX91840.1 peptidylprolyl isomerase [Methanoplanus endosymbiosus]
MTIKEGDFIRLSYTGKSDGIIFDTTYEEVAKEDKTFSEEKIYEPMVVRVGGNHLIPGLDEDLIGKETGTEYTIEISPDKAYGERNQELVRSAFTKDFKEKPTVGMRVRAEERQGVVVNVVGKRVVIDFNHMLAGKTITYNYTIESVIEEPKDQAAALFKLFCGKDMEMDLADGILTVILPPGTTYDKNYMYGKGSAIYQIFEYVEGVEEVILKESFKKPEIYNEETAEVTEATEVAAETEVSEVKEETAEASEE